MKSWIVICIVALMMVVNVSCGDDSDENASEQLGESGLSVKLLLSDLDEDQRLQYCQWKGTLLFNAANEASCRSDEYDPAMPSMSDCADNDDNFPSCLLGDQEACLTAISDDYCNENTPEACTPYSDCLEPLDPPANYNGLCQSPFGCGSYGECVSNCLRAFKCEPYLYLYKRDEDGNCLGYSDAI